MLETLELSGLMLNLALTCLASLVVALAKLALDAYRGTPTSLLDTVCEWIGFAGVVSIGSVVAEAHSRHLISSDLKVFITVMLFALWLAPRVAASLARPATKAAPAQSKTGNDA